MANRRVEDFPNPFSITGEKIPVGDRYTMAHVPKVTPQGDDCISAKADLFQQIAKAELRKAEKISGHAMLFPSLRSDQIKSSTRF
jgi:hypothetical protein